MKDVPVLPPSGFPHWLRNVRQVKFCTIWLFARIMRQMRINRIVTQNEANGCFPAGAGSAQFPSG